MPAACEQTGSYQGIIDESSGSSQFVNIKLTTENAKSNYSKRSLTFGEFIERAYGVYGKRKARGFVQLAIKAHLIEFRDHSFR
jgi:hypothetical protein